MKLTLVCSLLLLSGALAYGKAAERLHFPANGFSIEPLEDPSPDMKAPSAPLVMKLPPSGGFAPNLNVNIQPFTGTLEEYVKVSENQFTAGNYKVLNAKKLDDKTWVWEYRGTSNGVELRFYSKVLVTGKLAYLSTATATEPQWKKYADKLKSTVNSFKLD
jgi:hypothetical protein